MDDLGSRIKHITNELKDYVETKLELTMLNVSEKVSYWIGQSIQQLFGYTLLGVGLIFGMTALAIYLGEILNNEWAGYLIVASPFLLLGIIFVLIKPKSLARRIQSQILAEIIDSIETDEEPMRELTNGENNKQEA